MNPIETRLEKLLETAATITDWAAQDVVAVTLEPQDDNLHLLVDAVANLYRVRDRLRAAHPAAEPARTAERHTRLPQDGAYGPDNPMPAAVRELLEAIQASDLLDSLADAPNAILAEIARRERPRLETRIDALANQLRQA